MLAAVYGSMVGVKLRFHCCCLVFCCRWPCTCCFLYFISVAFNHAAFAPAAAALVVSAFAAAFIVIHLLLLLLQLLLLVLLLLLLSIIIHFVLLTHPPLSPTPPPSPPLVTVLKTEMSKCWALILRGLIFPRYDSENSLIWKSLSLVSTFFSPLEILLLTPCASRAPFTRHKLIHVWSWIVLR